MAAFIVIIIVLAVVVTGMWSAISTSIESGSVFQTLLAVAANVLGVFAIFATTYLWLNSHNLKFYLWIQRQRHKWFPSKSSTWDIQAKWRGSGGEESLNGFEKWLKGHYTEKLSVWKQVSGLRSYQVDGRFNVEVSYELGNLVENEASFTFILRIYALTVNFSESKEILNVDVMPLLTKMTDLIRPVANEQAYNLTMSFSERVNPFLGLYVQGLHPREIKQFQITVSPRSYNKESTGIVRVSPEQLSISTRSAREFEMMAVDFLSFAPGLARTSS